MRKTVKTESQPAVFNKPELMDDFIAFLRTMQLQVETKTAPEEMNAFYNAMHTEDIGAIYKFNKEHLGNYLLGQVKDTFLSYYTNSTEIKSKKMAFKISDNLVYIWAEVEDFNTEMYKDLLIAAADTNRIFADLDLTVQVGIVEESDNCTMPNDFETVWQ